MVILSSRVDWVVGTGLYSTWSFEPDSRVIVTSLGLILLLYQMISKVVKIVGHSLVPSFIEPVEGTSIEIFRSPGAKVSTFQSNQLLSNVLTIPHDLTILFIGGNDIHNNCTPSLISSNIEHLIEQVHSYCGSFIYFVLLEHRDPPIGNRFNIDADQYNRVANNINKRLKRKYKNASYVKFLSVSAKPFQRGVTDGIHFDRESEIHLRRKLRNTIKRFIEN